MDYYTNACEQLDGAEILGASQKYRIGVTLLCLSCELFLKSLVERKNPENPLLNSHDIVNLGNFLRDEIDLASLAPKLAFMRKYLNDSRYPFDSRTYTKELYQKCLESVLSIRQAIDSANAKKSDAERLSEKFGERKISGKDKE